MDWQATLSMLSMATASNVVHAVHGDSNGVLWFGTGNSLYFEKGGVGVSRYDGRKFVTLTTEDGLADNRVFAIHQDLDGVMWFGTRGGVSRYEKPLRPSASLRDGRFVNFTSKDGLLNNWVNAIHQDPDGVMWFGTGNIWDNEKGGVSRYDGKGFFNLTTKDGLSSNWVNAIHQDDDGMMWFGTGRVGVINEKGVVSRYDGKQFVNLTEEDGLLPGSHIDSICQDCDGVLWFGAHNKGGISRYDGRKFSFPTTEAGLVTNADECLLETGS